MVGSIYEEVVRSPEVPVSGGGVEVMYEMPSALPSHQPLPAIPLTETTPTGGDVGVAREEDCDVNNTALLVLNLISRQLNWTTIGLVAFITTYIHVIVVVVIVCIIIMMVNNIIVYSYMASLRSTMTHVRMLIE